MVRCCTVRCEYGTVRCGSVSTVRGSKYGCRLLLVTGSSSHSGLLTVVLVVSGEVFVVSGSVVEVGVDEDVEAKVVFTLVMYVCSVLAFSTAVVVCEVVVAPVEVVIVSSCVVAAAVSEVWVDVEVSPVVVMVTSRVVVVLVLVVLVASVDVCTIIVEVSIEFFNGTRVVVMGSVVVVVGSIVLVPATVVVAEAPDIVVDSSVVDVS